MIIAAGYTSYHRFPISKKLKICMYIVEKYLRKVHTNLENINVFIF